jgi:hypothetical protein
VHELLGFPLVPFSNAPSAITIGGLHAEQNARNQPTVTSLSPAQLKPSEADMNGLIYLVGLVVVILAILSFFGLR